MSGSIESTAMIFCTLFDRYYLPQGIALYRSLERTAGEGFRLYILCMDDFSVDALTRLGLQRAHVIRIAEFEDNALRAARANRPFSEYCWTCTAPLLLYILNRRSENEVVAYVDADIRFFSNPKTIVNELDEKSIFIHEHDFAPEYLHFQPAAGRFNVGVVVVRNDEEGRECLRRWNAQCLADCSLDLAAGRCGDQKYLDEWPDLYRKLVISTNPGVGLGPWNIGKRRLAVEADSILVDDRPIVFYHYHALRIRRPRLWIRPILMVQGEYTFSSDVVRAVYRPYARELWQVVTDLKKIGLSILQDLQPLTIEGFRQHFIQQRQLDFSMGMI
jgi:hypothetical protein